MKTQLWMILATLSLSACASLSRTPASGACSSAAQEPVSECRANLACPITDYTLLEGASAMNSGPRRGQALNAHRLCVEQNLDAQRSSLK